MDGCITRFVRSFLPSSVRFRQLCRLERTHACLPVCIPLSVSCRQECFFMNKFLAAGTSDRFRGHRSFLTRLIKTTWRGKKKTSLYKNVKKVRRSMPPLDERKSYKDTRAELSEQKKQKKETSDSESHSHPCKSFERDRVHALLIQTERQTHIWSSPGSDSSGVARRLCLLRLPSGVIPLRGDMPSLSLFLCPREHGRRRLCS
mmetsp:Transcript_38503/g.75624  ORF Transcript_38503/g.75624 Transcript_38503/m.75624 type:complete len:203 (-) Transcript_38503:150-758(-)